MVSIIHLRIIGTGMLVVGLLLLLYGILMVNKQALATSFIVIIIALALLYYTWRMRDRPF